MPSSGRKGLGKPITTRPENRCLKSNELASVTAPVAQLDRVGGFEPLGREFESLRVRHIKNPRSYERGFFIWRIRRMRTPASSTKRQDSRFGHRAFSEMGRRPEVHGCTESISPRPSKNPRSYEWFLMGSQLLQMRLKNTTGGAYRYGKAKMGLFRSTNQQTLV